MSIKSALIISGAILAAALGIYWIAAPREACPEELYRQYMQLSPFEQFDQKEKLLKKAAQAGLTAGGRLGVLQAIILLRGF